MEKNIIVNRASYEVFPKSNAGRKGKAVICITTGEIFKSATEAGYHYDIPPISISQNCKGTVCKTRGMKFAYVEDLCYKADEVAHRIAELNARLDSIHERERVLAEQREKFKEMVEKQQRDNQQMIAYISASNF